MVASGDVTSRPPSYHQNVITSHGQHGPCMHAWPRFKLGKTELTHFCQCAAGLKFDPTNHKLISRSSARSQDNVHSGYPCLLKISPLSAYSPVTYPRLASTRLHASPMFAATLTVNL